MEEGTGRKAVGQPGSLQSMGGRNTLGNLTLPPGIEIYQGKTTESMRIAFRYQGKRYRQTLKLPVTKTNIKFAERLRGQILLEIEKGVFDFRKHFPNAAHPPNTNQPTTQTVGEALLAYLEANKKTTAVSTWRDYQSAIRCHLTPSFGTRLLRELTTTEIRAWMGGLTIGPKRINNILVPLRGVFKDAFADEVINRNPMDRIRNLRVVTEEPDPLDQQERHSVLEAIADMGFPQAGNLIQFAFWSGLRTSELLVLEWGDVDWLKGVVRVRRANVRGDIKAPKTAAGEREVFLLPPAMEALSNQKAHSFLMGGIIFRRDWDGEPWTNDNQISKRVWGSALRKAGVRHRGIYQTRHTYASILLSANENPTWIARQMGHADITMLLRRYGRWMQGEDPTMVKRLAEKFGVKNATIMPEKAI